MIHVFCQLKILSIDISRSPWVQPRTSITFWMVKELLYTCIGHYNAQWLTYVCGIPNFSSKRIYALDIWHGWLSFNVYILYKRNWWMKMCRKSGKMTLIYLYYREPCRMQNHTLITSLGINLWSLYPSSTYSVRLHKTQAYVWPFVLSSLIKTARLWTLGCLWQHVPTDLEAIDIYIAYILWNQCRMTDLPGNWHCTSLQTLKSILCCSL